MSKSLMSHSCGRSPDPPALLHPLLGFCELPSFLPIYYVDLSLTSFPTQPGSHIQCVSYTLPGPLTSGPPHFRATMPSWGPICLGTLHLGSNDLSAQEPSMTGKKTKKSHSLRNSCHYNNGPWSRMGIESHQYFHSVFLTILSTLEY